MFIDMHSHVYRYQYPIGDNKYLFITLEQLIKRHDAIGIDRAVLLPIVSPEVYVPQSVGEIIEIADNSEGRFIPFCNVDPRVLTNTSDAPIGNLLNHYKELGCKGIGEVLPNMEFRDPKMMNLFRHAQETGFPLLFVLSGMKDKSYGLYDEPGLPQLEESLQRYPDLFFIGHGPAFWAEIGTLDHIEDRYGYPRYPIRSEGAVPKLLRKYPNMLADLSAGSGANALRRDPGFAAGFINEFQDKLFFGTDLCTYDDPSYIADFLMSLRREKKISENVFQKIAKENAVKLLKL